MSSGFKGGDPVELGRKGGIVTQAARRGEHREKPIDEEAEMEKLARSPKTPPAVKQQALSKLADIRDRRKQKQQPSINEDILSILSREHLDTLRGWVQADLDAKHEDESPAKQLAYCKKRLDEAWQEYSGIKSVVETLRRELESDAGQAQ
jgi:hypothetical protein